MSHRASGCRVATQCEVERIRLESNRSICSRSYRRLRCRRRSQRCANWFCRSFLRKLLCAFPPLDESHIFCRILPEEKNLMTLHGRLISSLFTFHESQSTTSMSSDTRPRTSSGGKYSLGDVVTSTLGRACGGTKGAGLLTTAGRTGMILGSDGIGTKLGIGGKYSASNDGTSWATSFCSMGCGAKARGASVGNWQPSLSAPLVQQYFPRPLFSQQSALLAPFTQQKSPEPPLTHCKRRNFYDCIDLRADSLTAGSSTGSSTSSSTVWMASSLNFDCGFGYL